MWVFAQVSLLRGGINTATVLLCAGLWLANSLDGMVASAQSPDEAALQQQDPATPADSALLLWHQAVSSGNSARLQEAVAATARLQPLHLTATSLEQLSTAMDAATARLGSADAETARVALQNFLPSTLAVPATPRGSQYLAALALRLARYQLLQDQPEQAGDCLHVADVLIERAAAGLPDASASRLLLAHSRETARLLTLAGTTADALQRLERTRILLLSTPDAATDLAELAMIAALLSHVEPITKYRLLESLLLPEDGGRLIVPDPAWKPVAPSAVLLQAIPQRIRDRWFTVPAPAKSAVPHAASVSNPLGPILPLAELVRTAVAGNLAEDLEARLNTLVNEGHAPALLARLMLRLELNRSAEAADDALKLLIRNRTADAIELRLDQQLLWALQESGHTPWLLNHPALEMLPPQSSAVAEQARGTTQKLLPANALLWCEDPEFGRDSGPLIRAAEVSGDGLLLHQTMRGSASCLLPWPVSGPATLSLRTLLAPTMQAGTGFDAFAVLTAAASERSLAAGLGSQPSVSRAGRFQQPGEFGWQSVRVQPADVRFAVNGHSLWQMPAEPTSFPWLMLQIDGFGMGAFSDLQLADTMPVLREVRLSADASLHGWSAHRYGQLLPLSRRTPAVTAGTSGTAPTRNADWFAVDDTISGRSIVDPVAAGDAYPLATLAFLQYQRPLRPGDVLTWEYDFQPGADGDCLALGSLAIRVRPEGVFLHGVPAGPTEWILFPPERECRADQRTSELLPVRSGWNTASLRIESLRGVLTVNDQEVLELPLESLSDTRPGLCYRRSRPPVKVRRMVLRGDWPEQVSNAQLQELLQAESSGRVAEEWLQQQRAAEVLEQSRSETLETRWQQLSAWVLPSAAPGQLRTAGRLADPAADIASGLRIDSPLQELIRVAMITGRLEQLEDRLQLLPAIGLEAVADRAAALALCAVMARQPDAGKLLEELVTLLSAGAHRTSAARGTALALPPQRPPHCSVWPLLAICEAALPRPEHAGVLLRLLDTPPMSNPAETSGSTLVAQPAWPALQALTASLRIRLQQAAAAHVGTALKVADANVPDLPLSSPTTRLRTWQQTVFSPEGCASVAAGSSEWLALTDGSVLLAQRFADVSLISPSPVVGNFVFELRVRVAADEVAAARQLPLVGFAGVCWLPAGTDSVVQLPWRESLSHAVAARETAIPPSAAEPASPAETKPASRPAATPGAASGNTTTRRWRLERRGLDLTLTLDDRLVLQQTLTGREPPWLMLRCGREPGAIIEELRLDEMGAATEITTISLPFTAELAGWDRPRFSRGSVFRPERQAEADWRMDEARLVGAFRSESVGSWRPGQLCFMPPLPERGAVSWSFRYEPGRSMVHPTVGDQVLLLEPGAGIRVGALRQITEDRVELSAAKVQAASVLIEGSRCDLSTDVWQQASLEISGSDIELRLNGIPAATLKLATQQDRRLGFFHWSDQTAAEIRSLQLELR
jgi:hypothetical protein